MRKLFLIIPVVGTLSLSLFFLFQVGILRFNYPSHEEFPVRGIDISHHQGEIQWRQLSGNKISFVFIKATEGGDYQDPKFQDNWTKAKANGQLAIGAYHFYRLCKNGKEQAENFIATVPKLDLSLPPVIDLEFGGNCQTSKTTEQIIGEIRDCINLMQRHYNRTPILYVTHDFYSRYLQQQFTECPIWIRDIYGRPQLKDKRKWAFWQFANRGRIDGVNGPVDLNVFNGSRAAFEKFANGR